MPDSLPTITVREAALALSVIDLHIWKQEQRHLKSLLGRQRERTYSIDRQRETAIDLDKDESNNIREETDSSLRHLSDIQAAFEFACERCLSTRFLIINHCKALDDCPIKLSNALALEEVSLEKAYLIKNEADREGVLPKAISLNNRLSKTQGNDS